VDAFISGVNYTCSSGSTGITNIDGNITCENNDTVSLFLGSISLGTISMTSNFITPDALFPNDPVASLNFAQLAQSLDRDQNTSNGIDIDLSLLTSLNTIDFSSPSFDADMQALLGNIPLVSEADALVHLETTFIELDINDDGSSPRDTPTPEPTPTPTVVTTPAPVTTTTTLLIKSAVYDNKRTVAVNDDVLYLYMNESIDPTSINVDRSINYTVVGTGTINSSSASDYNDTTFHLNTLNLTAGSAEFVTDTDTILIKTNQITDANGLTAVGTIATVVEKLIYIKKTGQTISYQENGDVNASILDDGHYETGLTPSYTRDAGTGIVTDNLTELMWQDNESVQKQWLTTVNYNTCAGDTSDPVCYDTSGDTAAAYCTALGIGGFGDWRMPTSTELEGIVDYSKTNPSIDPTFTNTSSNVYWTSTTVLWATAIRALTVMLGVLETDSDLDF